MYNLHESNPISNCSAPLMRSLHVNLFPARRRGKFITSIGTHWGILRFRGVAIWLVHFIPSTFFRICFIQFGFIYEFSFWRAGMCGMNRAEGGELIILSGHIDHQMSVSDARCHRQLHLHASRCSLRLDRERFPFSFHKKKAKGTTN
jgi:hypothetical protein